MEDHDLDEPQRPITLPHAERRKSTWDREIIQESERYGVEGKRERERDKNYSLVILYICVTS